MRRGGGILEREPNDAVGGLIGLPVLDGAGRLSELICGSAGLFERMTGRVQPTSVPWSRVKKITARGVVLD